MPSLNFEATDYVEIIDWAGPNVSITVPAVLKNISNEELIKKLSDKELVAEWKFCKFPCHTVAVERTVKLVTEASAKICGWESRNRYIKSTLQSREICQDSKRNMNIWITLKRTAIQINFKINPT